MSQEKTYLTDLFV